MYCYSKSRDPRELGVIALKFLKVKFDGLNKKASHLILVLANETIHGICQYPVIRPNLQISNVPFFI
jgi:hypothetical protein